MSTTKIPGFTAGNSLYEPTKYCVSAKVIAHSLTGSRIIEQIDCPDPCRCENCTPTPQPPVPTPQPPVPTPQPPVPTPQPPVPAPPRCPVGCYEANVACTGFLLWNTCWCRTDGRTCPTGGWWVGGVCLGFWNLGCIG
jgi:hypothetical protein